VETELVPGLRLCVFFFKNKQEASLAAAYCKMVLFSRKASVLGGCLLALLSVAMLLDTNLERQLLSFNSVCVRNTDLDFRKRLSSLIDAAGVGVVLPVPTTPKQLLVSVGYEDLSLYSGCVGRPCAERLVFSELEFYKRILNRNSFAIDCGGNNGFLSNYFASLGATVHAFEMLPLTALRWEQTALLNGMGDKMSLHRLGLSNMSGQVWFPSLQDQGSGHSGGKRLSEGRLEKSAVTGEIAVPVDTLDSVLFSNIKLHTQPTLLKLDIEGSEFLALQGAQRLLSLFPPKYIIIEHGPYLMTQRSGDMTHSQALFALLQSNRFQMFLLCPMDQMASTETIANAIKFLQRPLAHADSIPEDMRTVVYIVAVHVDALEEAHAAFGLPSEEREA
jgi:FkbM family methyltransferase